MKIKSELKPYLKSLYVGLSVFVLSCGYQTTQNFQSGINEKYGYISVALVYFCYGIGQFITPAIIQWLTPKYSIFVAGLCYLFYIATNIKVIIPLYLIASAVCGFGASLLWSSGSTLLSGYEQNVKKNDLIYSLFYVPTFMCFLGNIVPLIFTPNSSESTTIVFILLSCVSLVGCLMFLFTPNSPPIPMENVKDLIFSSLKNFSDWRIALFFPLAMLFGFSRSFYYTTMPILAPVEYTAYIFILNGFTMSVATYIWGKINKMMNEHVSLISAIVIEMICCVFGFVINEIYLKNGEIEPSKSTGLIVLVMILGALSGVCDSALEVVSTALFNRIYPKQVDPLCTWRIVYLTTITVALIYSAFAKVRLVLFVFAISTIIALIFSVTIALFYDKWYKEIEEKNHKRVTEMFGKPTETKELIDDDDSNEVPNLQDVSQKHDFI